MHIKNIMVCMVISCTALSLQAMIRTVSGNPLGEQLLQAVENKDINHVTMLLEFGADPNTRLRRNNATLLHRAFIIYGVDREQGQEGEEVKEIIRLLLQYGADSMLPDGAGHSVLDYAESLPNKTIYNLLQPAAEGAD